MLTHQKKIGEVIILWGTLKIWNEQTRVLMTSHVKVEKLSGGKKEVQKWRKISPKKKMDLENYNENWTNKKIIQIKNVEESPVNKFKIQGKIADIVPYQGSKIYKGDPDNKFKKIKKKGNTEGKYVYGFEVLINEKNGDDEIRLNVFDKMGQRIMGVSAEEFDELNEEAQDKIVQHKIEQQKEYIFCIATKISNKRGKGYIVQEIETPKGNEAATDDETSETWKTEERESEEATEEPETKEEPKKKRGRPKKKKNK